MIILQIVFALCFLFNNLSAYEFLRIDDKVIIEKYKLDGRSVWSEDEKSAIIDTSISTVTYISFIPSITIDELNIFDEIILEKIKFSDIETEMIKRQSKKYNIEKMIEMQKSIDAALNLHAYHGFDVSEATESYKKKIEIYKYRYNSTKQNE